MNAKVNITNRAGASFPVRRMNFEFNDVPEYWMNGSAGLTHFMTALSALFPAGFQQVSEDRFCMPISSSAEIACFSSVPSLPEWVRNAGKSVCMGWRQPETPLKQVVSRQVHDEVAQLPL